MPDADIAVADYTNTRWEAYWLLQDYSISLAESPSSEISDQHQGSDFQGMCYTQNKNVLTIYNSLAKEDEEDILKKVNTYYNPVTQDKVRENPRVL